MCSYFFLYLVFSFFFFLICCLFFFTNFFSILQINVVNIREFFFVKKKRKRIKLLGLNFFVVCLSVLKVVKRLLRL